MASLILSPFQKLNKIISQNIDSSKAEKYKEQADLIMAYMYSPELLKEQNMYYF